MHSSQAVTSRAQGLFYISSLSSPPEKQQGLLLLACVLNLNSNLSLLWTPSHHAQGQALLQKVAGHAPDGKDLRPFLEVLQQRRHNVLGGMLPTASCNSSGSGGGSGRGRTTGCNRNGGGSTGAGGQQGGEECGGGQLSWLVDGGKSSEIREEGEIVWF